MWVKITGLSLNVGQDEDWVIEKIRSVVQSTRTEFLLRLKTLKNFKLIKTSKVRRLKMVYPNRCHNEDHLET